MAARLPSVALGDPPDPPFFGSFRPSTSRRGSSLKNPVLGFKPNGAGFSQPMKVAALPLGSSADIRPKIVSFKRSFADVAKSGVPKSQVDITYFGETPPLPGASVCSEDGEVVLKFAPETIKSLSSPFKWALVGKFSHGVATYSQIGKFFSNLKLSSKFELKWLSPRQMLVVLFDENDYTKVWVKGMWQVAGFPMRLIKWSPTFDVKRESAIVPVWIRLPGLPAQFFERKSLFLLASTVGKPLKVNLTTAKRASFKEAKVCVEMDLLAPVLRHFVLEFNGVRLTQNIIYENLPEYCNFCSHIGHAVDSCYIKNVELKPVRLNNAKTVVAGDSKGHLLMAQPSSLGQTVVEDMTLAVQFLKLQSVHGLYTVVNSVLPMLKCMELHSPFLGLRLSKEFSFLLSSPAPACVFSDVEEGEIFEEERSMVDFGCNDVVAAMVSRSESEFINSVHGSGVVASVDVDPLHACNLNGLVGDDINVTVSVDNLKINAEPVKDQLECSIVEYDISHSSLVMAAEALHACEFERELVDDDCIVTLRKDIMKNNAEPLKDGSSVENDDGNSVVEDDIISVEDDGYQIAGGPELWRDDSFGPLGSRPSSTVVGSVHLGRIPLVHIPTPIFNWKSELVSQKGGPVVRRQKAIKQSIRPSWQTDALHATPLQSIPPSSGYYFSDPDEQREYLEFKKSNPDYVETDYGSDSSVSSSYFGDEDESHAPKVSTTGKVTSPIPLICPPLRRSPRVSKKVYY